MDFISEIEKARKSLRNAVIRTVVVTVIALAGIILLSNVWINATIQKEKQNIKANLIQTVTLARNSIELDLIPLRIGSITRQEALDRISAKLRQMTYKDAYGDNYIFLLTYKGDLLVQPFQPELENTNQWDMQDTKGIYLIRELVRIGKSNSTGDFLTYFYKPPGTEIPEEKMSFAVAIPELESVIGSGMYMKKYYENQTLAIRQTSWLVVLLLILIVGNIAFSINRSVKLTKDLEAEIRHRAEAQMHLVDSEINLRTVFHSMSDAIIIHDLNGRIIEVNDPMLKMFGVKKADIIGQHIELISAPGEFSDKKTPEIWEKVQNEDSAVFEYRCRRIDNGEPFYGEVALRNALWVGKPVFLAAIRDINKRKIIERELRHSQKVNEHAEEIGLFGYFTVDFLKGYVNWSKGLYKIFNRDPNLPPPTVDEYFSMICLEDQERVNTLQKQSTASGDPLIIEYSIQREDGEKRDLFVKNEWVFDGNNSVRYLIGAIQDITAIRKAQEEIRQSEEKFRSIVEQMSEGFILIDENGEIAEWNKSQERISGIPAEQVLSKKIWEVQPLLGYSEDHGETPEEYKKNLSEVIATGISDIFDTEFEVTINTIAGEQRVLLQNTFPIKFPGGYRIGLIVHDITEQTAAKIRVAHEMQKLESLRNIDTFILERTSIEKTLNLVCAISVDLLKVDGAVIVTKCNDSRIAHGSFLQFGSIIEDFFNREIESEIANMERLAESQLSINEFIQSIQIDSFDIITNKTIYTSVLPIFVNKNICGYFKIFSCNPLLENPEIRGFFLTLAGQASLALENSTLIGDLTTAYDETIAGWSKALELKDKETKGHSDRVTELAVELAQKANYPDERMVHFRRGVLLHDIGKMGVPDEILLKPGKLTEEDWMIMKDHPKYAYDLLSKIPYLKEALEIPYGHHERWDGSGYPLGLQGESIPLSARIFAIVDVWDALSTERPYKKAWASDDVRNYLKSMKAIHFDPQLVDLFLDILDENSL